MRGIQRRGVWIGAGALLWLVTIVSLYYVLHKPIPPAVATARAVADLILAAGLVAVAGGLGRRLCPQPHPDGLASLVFQASLGLGFASLLVLAAGFAGLLQRWVLWLVLGALAAVLWRDVGAWLVGCREGAREQLARGGFGRLLAVLSAVIVSTSLVEALAPPVRFDALVYHLALPHAFLGAQRLVFTPDNPYWGMPLGVEMIYTWAMALGRPQTGAVMGWLMGVLTLTGVLALGRGLGRSVGWVAVAALLCGETLAASLGWAYADWLVAVHAVALIIGLDAWRRQPRWELAAWAGLAAGFAFGAKYSGGIVAAGGLLALLLVGAVRRRAQAAAAFAGAAFMAALPGLVKNALFTGDPLFPFLGQSPWMTAARQAFYRGLPFTPPGLDVILTPMLATLEGVEGAPGFSASLGPLLLGLLPGLLLIRRRQAQQLVALGIYLVVGWLAWIAGRVYSLQLAQSRLYYGLYPVWAILAGAGFSGLSRVRIGRVRVRRVAQALVTVVLGFAAVFSMVNAVQSRAAAAASGIESESDYRLRRLGAYVVAIDQVRALGQASVLFLWEARGMDCSTCRPDAWIDRWYADRHEYGAAGDILSAWRASGVTHVLLYRAGLRYVQQNDSRYTPEDWAELQALLSLLVPVNAAGEGYTLYRLP
ncbi:MAG: hypothetical protein AB1449_11885 [Chloroflexota bacterium]